MDDLIASFNLLGVSNDVKKVIESDILAMANHYISCYTTSEMPHFSPNPICDYGDVEALNRGILEYITKKGEGALIEKIKSIQPLIQISYFDISTYINYYVSLIELSMNIG
mgnify:CR=1 FL=1|tara:strand:- start:130 stop:462 length:333 start_codon:yes stop_codon:yes gene_type:complete